ncbi:hypothetical protein BofuT4_P084620.1 [Botrytis cinerea T4]|uniref:Uncharacterized protein n=1 Tax=Botryotinia fuckeliana (strain T4) TaxID=999810 RepID=G2YJM1_BOTF4|nr:hypothetical protein BofuT4_P084620.1 [Botrytis cinerea T4]
MLFHAVRWTDFRYPKVIVWEKFPNYQAAYLFLQFALKQMAKAERQEF